MNGYGDQADIALAFCSGEEIMYDYRNCAQQCCMLHDHFSGLGWKVPDMLAHLE